MVRNGQIQDTFVFFFGCAVLLAGSQFPDQGLNLGPGSESTESYNWTDREFPQDTFLSGEQRARADKLHVGYERE